MTATPNATSTAADLMYAATQLVLEAAKMHHRHQDRRTAEVLGWATTVLELSEDVEAETSSDAAG